MESKNKESKKNSLINADVSNRASVSISDVAGLGKVAKSPAGLEIARAVGGPIGNAVDTFTTALLGRRAARVRAESRTLEARAEAEARILAAETEEEIRRLRVTAKRVRSEELRKSDYIESATEKAILIADKRGDNVAASLTDELTLSWIDGVKNTHSQEVRDLYSRILANQTVDGTDMISGPSLALLKNLDSKLAESFKKYVAAYCTFGSYPYSTNMLIDGKLALSRHEVDMLSEIGFLKDTSPERYAFEDIFLSSGGSLGYLYSCIGFTRRSFELAVAIFGRHPLQGELSSYVQPDEYFIENLERLLIGYAIDYHGDMYINFLKHPNIKVKIPHDEIIIVKSRESVISQKYSDPEQEIKKLSSMSIISSNTEMALIKFLSHFRKWGIVENHD